MRNPIYIALLCACVLLAGCTKSRCWKGNGSGYSESRFLDDFETLHIEGNVDVNLVQDTLHLAKCVNEALKLPILLSL